MNSATDSKDKEELYLRVIMELLAIIFKLYTGDIDKQTALDRVKGLTRPDLYNNFYHQFILKDITGPEDLYDTKITELEE